MTTNSKSINKNKIIMISIAILISFMLILIPMQSNASAAATAHSNVTTVEYNGSTYHARYYVQLASTYANLGTNPYEFRDLSSIKLVEKSVTNGWLTYYNVKGLTSTLTGNNHTYTTSIEDYSFYTSAPTKTLHENLNLSPGTYTLNVKCTIKRGGSESKINKTVTFKIIA